MSAPRSRSDPALAETTAPTRPRRGVRWLLRQLLFWLVVALVPLAIWKIVTWPVGLPTPR